jgi:hypothetical protein
MRKNTKRHHYIVWGAVIAACIIGVLLFLYGSSGVLNVHQKVITVNKPIAVPFLKIASGMRSTVSTRTNYIITSTEQFTKLWDMIDATGTPPNIDFKSDEAIAVFAGNESTASSTILITRMYDTTTQRTIYITLRQPVGDCTEKQIKNQKTTAPYEIVLVPFTRLKLAHKDTIATTSCPKI